MEEGDHAGWPSTSRTSSFPFFLPSPSAAAAYSSPSPLRRRGWERTQRRMRREGAGVDGGWAAPAAALHRVKTLATAAGQPPPPCLPHSRRHQPRPRHACALVGDCPEATAGRRLGGRRRAGTGGGGGTEPRPRREEEVEFGGCPEAAAGCCLGGRRGGLDGGDVRRNALSDSCSGSSSSSVAKIRSEVLSPFRSVRMFFYLAFMASGGLGSLIALTRLIPALGNPARAAGVPEMLRGLGIDVAAVAVFAFLYSRDRKASDAQVARLTREENLSRLKLRVGGGGRVVPVSELRGSARLVIVAGPAEFVAESFRRSRPFLKDLMERGVLVLPFPTDGNAPALEFDESDDGEAEDEDEIGKKSRRLWQLAPVYTAEWGKWLDEQKKLANVTPDSPVYLSLRMDGRVRGSGVGYPPWQAFVAQLPQVKGMWSGLFDGMDGRV